MLYKLQTRAIIWFFLSACCNYLLLHYFISFLIIASVICSVFAAPLLNA
jgi:hypothetical protein